MAFLRDRPVEMSRFFPLVRPYLVALPARTPDPERRLRLVVDESGVKKSDIEPCSDDVEEVRSSPRVRKPSAAPAERAPGQKPHAERTLGERTIVERPHAERTLAERTLAEQDDSELVALYRAGQAAAFEALYRRYSAYAMALGVRVQGSATDIEDIVHDAFLRVNDRLDTLREGASFRPWLASVVVSLVRTRLRKRRMLSMLGLVSADPIDLDALVNHDAGPEVRAQIAQVYAVLRTVPVDQSICWTLRYVEGRKLEEVAEVAKCSLATAKRRIAQVQAQMLLLDSQGAHEGASWFQAAPESDDAVDNQEADQ